MLFLKACADTEAAGSKGSTYGGGWLLVVARHGSKSMDSSTGISNSVAFNGVKRAEVLLICGLVWPLAEPISTSSEGEKNCAGRARGERGQSDGAKYICWDFQNWLRHVLDSD